MSDFVVDLRGMAIGFAMAIALAIGVRFGLRHSHVNAEDFIMEFRVCGIEFATCDTFTQFHHFHLSLVSTTSKPANTVSRQ